MLFFVYGHHVDLTSLLLRESLETLVLVEREAARRCLLSPEQAMRIKRNRCGAQLRRSAERRLYDTFQRQAAGDASVDPAISSGSVGA